MKITSASHLDHSLLPVHVAYITARFEARDAFFVDTFELPAELPEVPCGLHGPLVGDLPVTDEVCVMLAREGRSGPSRLVDRAPRPTRTLTVIAGPHEGSPCVLYTAFGGPLAPREPWDPSLSPEQAAESRAFWAEHALSI